MTVMFIFSLLHASQYELGSFVKVHL